MKKVVNHRKLIVLNSHYQFREFRQLAKSTIHTAIRSFSPKVQVLLVSLLTEENTAVDEAHATEVNRVLVEPDEPHALDELQL